ncbi:hypothetical protein ACWDA7_17405 [Streptomyces sp. NPDC001156]
MNIRKAVTKRNQFHGQGVPLACRLPAALWLIPIRMTPVSRSPLPNRVPNGRMPGLLITHPKTPCKHRPKAATN